ncbi:vitellogenin receptor-like [Planococcus citri]|uniref:vitellogenin receptor-like n=1 Tax=Planococcus citri TaxID=170843 RepID=UPI0031F7B6C1
METGAYILRIILSMCCISQIYSTTKYPRFTFRCKNGQYIRSEYFCDGFSDCNDESDDPSLCNTWNCGEGKFSCSSNSTTEESCKNAELLCNTHKDCPDGYDESNCGDEINVENCDLYDGKFLCLDKTRCIGLENVCDGVINCLDGSDENENCTKIDYESLDKCAHSYFPSPLESGPLCFCESDDDLSNDLCQGMRDCTFENQKQCTQRCSQYKNRVLCSCHEDYIAVPVGKGFRCQSRDHQGPMLIYSTATHIKSLNTTSKKLTVLKKNIQSRILAAAADSIYYTTYKDDSKSIFSLSSDGSTKQIVNSSSPIISIDVDYITGNVYFTTNGSLSICSKNGEFCRMLIRCNVSHVTLTPKLGWMYYIKAAGKPGERLIMRSNMDGSYETVFIDGTFSHSLRIVADESFERLYWLEAENNQVFSISLQEDAHKIEHTLINFGHDLNTLSILRVLDGIIYYTLRRDNKIYLMENVERFVSTYFSAKIDKKSSPELYMNQLGIADLNATLYTDEYATISIRDFQLYNSIRQISAKAKNPCRSSPCSNLCLIYPTLSFASSLDKLGYNCIDISSNDNHQCEESDSIGSLPTEDTSFPLVQCLVAVIVPMTVLGAAIFIYCRYRRAKIIPNPSQDERIIPNDDNIIESEF